MVRKLFINLLVAVCAVTCAFGIAACGETPHEHSASDKWSYDDEYHWHNCEGCDLITFNYAEHVYIDGYCFCGKAQGHVHSYTETVIPPTCTERGYTLYTCSCSDSYEDNYVDALGHNISTYAARAATCTAVGWKAYEACTRCDYSTYEEIAALGHDRVQHGAQAATCTAIGWDAYETCTRCDYSTYEEIAALGHDRVQHGAQAATCTVIGWGAFETCTRCDYSTYEEIAALGHDVIQHEAQAATCTETGWEAYETCSRCDYTTYDELSALGHNFGEYAYNDDATCTEDGTETATCSRCDAIGIRTADGTAKGHNTVSHLAKAASCTEIGWAAYETCTRCDYTTYEEIPALDHDYIYYDPSDPTCTEEGWLTYCICSRCDFEFKYTLPALGHVIAEHEGKPATCTESGWEAYETCARCDFTSYKEIPALGHDFSDWFWITGEQHREQCSRCEAYNDGEHEYHDDVCDICNFYKNTSINLSFDFVTNYLNEPINEYAVVGMGDETDKEIIIPSTYMGKPVTEIGYKAFQFENLDYGNVESIIIPDSVKLITCTLSACTNLMKLIIPDSVKSIPYNISTAKCTTIYCEASSKPDEWSTDWSRGNSAIVWDYLNNDVAADGYIYTVVGGVRYAIKNDEAEVARQGEGITELDIRSVITYNGVEYPVTIIRDSSCGVKLKKLVIPETVKYIGSSAFAGCVDLEEVYYNASDFAETVAPNGMHINPFYNSGNNARLIVGENVTVIPDYMFYDFIGLSHVELSNSIKEIGVSAFYGCTNLNYYKDDGAKYLGNDFNHYLALMDITDKTITSFTMKVGTNLIDGAFSDCTQLTSIVMSDTVKSVLDGAFARCTNLRDITWSQSLTLIGKSAFSECTSLGDIVLPNSLTTIGRYAFYKSSLTSISFSFGVVSIGEYAFAECSKITDVILPNSINFIGSYAFYHCVRLGNVNIPESVMIIESRAFFISNNNLIVYCVSAEKPVGWDDDWNLRNIVDEEKQYCEVVWGSGI